MEEEQSQQRELALEKDKMATAFDNLKNLVEEDADTEAEYVKVHEVEELCAEIRQPCVDDIGVAAANIGCEEDNT